MTVLSVIIPVYNEKATVLKVIDRCQRCAPAGSELIIVDDGSTDGSREILTALSRESHDIRFIFKEVNGGKTSAVLAGLEIATGQWILVQDADLEYHPADIMRMLDCVGKETPVVYGRRPSCWQMPSRWLFAGGVLLVDVLLLCVYRRWVRDHASCYKLIPRECLARMQLQSAGFEGCVEITAKLMNSGISIKQVPISYAPRSAAEGKKLRVRYGWTAVRSVLRWRNWTPVDE